MVVGDDVAVGIDDEARAERGAAALLLLAALAVEEFLEQLLERRARRQLRQVAQARALLGHVLGGGDVDHGRHQHFDQVGEACRRVARLSRCNDDGLDKRQCQGGARCDCGAPRKH